MGNKYYDRLYQEWLQYGKIIVAVDFDDTICSNTKKRWKKRIFGILPLHS